jgi:hypothetical protein
MIAWRLNAASLALATTLMLGATVPVSAKSLSVIHGFNRGANLGGGLVVAANGTLYGVLANGGGCGEVGCVYSLTPPAQAGDKWTYAVLYKFQRGDFPEGQLTLGPGGELYGYTGYGSGKIYRLTPPASGSGAWTFTILGVLEGGFYPNPASPLIYSNGALYGIASGGMLDCACGEMFRLSDRNTAWELPSVYAFNGLKLGGVPAGFAGPDAYGGFYVANQYRGVVVYLRRYGPAWRAMAAASFPKSTGLACLVAGADGNIYGVAGFDYRGKLFKITPHDGATRWTKAVIADIGDHGNAPCPEINGPDGSLIGTVIGNKDFYSGDIFQLSPPEGGSGSWTYQILTKVIKTHRYGPINAVFGWQGDLYVPVDRAFGPPAAILKYKYEPPSPK